LRPALQSSRAGEHSTTRDHVNADFAEVGSPLLGRAMQGGPSIRAAVGVPISVAGELWGVMIAASRSERLPADTQGTAGQVRRTRAVRVSKDARDLDLWVWRR
jgi:GAF domain-containing protein